MTMSSYPFAGQPVNDVQYSQLMSALQETGVVGNPLGTALLVTADATGMSVQLQPGSAFVRGHFFNSTAVESLAIEPSDAASRIDRVVLRLDRDAKEVLPRVIRGTPAANPSAPSLVQTSTGAWEMLLADVPVPGGAVTIQPDGPQPKRPFVGSQVGVWTTDTRPAGRVGVLGFNTSIGKLERWDGDWSTITPVWADIEGKPATFPPSAHTHSWGDLRNIPIGTSSQDGLITANYVQFLIAAAPNPDGDNLVRRNSDGDFAVNYPSATTHPSSVQYVLDKLAEQKHSAADITSGSLDVNRVVGSNRAWTGTRTSSSWATVEVDSNGYFSKYTSTLRNKKNIRDLPVSALEVVNASRPVIFDRTDGVTVDEMGFIAEEMHEILPEATFTDEDGQIEGIHDVELHSVAWKAIQELSDLVAELSKRLNSLDGGSQ